MNNQAALQLQKQAIFAKSKAGTPAQTKANLLIKQLTAYQSRERIQELERRSESSVIRGDFAGSVTGSWVELRYDGGGIVKYNDKEYVTVTIGFVSLPKGSTVEMTYANGIYYSKF